MAAAITYRVNDVFNRVALHVDTHDELRFVLATNNEIVIEAEEYSAGNQLVSWLRTFDGIPSSLSLGMDNKKWYVTVELK